MDISAITSDEAEVLRYFATWAPVDHAVKNGTLFRLLHLGLVEASNAWPYKRITDAGLAVLGMDGALPLPVSYADPNSYALEGGSGSCLRCGSALRGTTETGWKHYLSGNDMCPQEYVTPKVVEAPPAAPPVDVMAEVLLASRQTSGRCHYCGLPVGPRGCEECV